MFSKTVIISALAGLAVAAPASRGANSNVFQVVASHSGSTIHLSAINASGQNFFIGKPTSTYCPSGISGLDCSTTAESTIFVANTVGNTLGLYASVPGGQQVYVAPDGSLKYTGAHSASMPQGSSITPFVYTTAVQDGGVGSLTFDVNGLFACPVSGSDGVYQIYATKKSTGDGCTGIAFATSQYSGSAAWQYT